MGPDRKNYWVPLPALDYFKSFSPLLDARYVSAHRVVAPWMGIQTAEILPETAENLSVFLQTLRGNKPRAFQKIEEVMKEIFPSIAFVNPATQANRVEITLSHGNIERDIRLTHSGTGVEQVLAIAAFAITAQPGAILLLDEPHSFLHPTAERQLISFLKRDNKHQYVIGTHSAIFINSVEADRIIQVEPQGSPYQPNRAPAELGRLLLDLGYKNSDILFHDFLIIVEGKSDRAILPILLTASGASNEDVAKTGFPALEGTPATTKDLQNAITRYEKLIATISRKHLRRIYLLDGDRSPADNELLKKMRSAEGTESVPIRFLPKPEIENYLLVPDAIHAALKEEAKLAGVSPNEITASEVKKRLDEILKHTEDKAVFPLGSTTAAKGSAVLQKLYTSFENLRYDKVHSGLLIARHINQENQPALSELRELTNDLFVEARAAAAAR
jgi:energy-coupling factor transporter ATP-binding protein EcfA2